MLRSWRKGKGAFVNRRDPNKLAMEVMEELEVVTPSISTPVRRLSGGNVQKVLVGREIAMSPSVLLTAYAVRGLDINTSYTIYNLLTQQKMKGSAVVFVGEDLDVLLEPVSYTHLGQRLSQCPQPTQSSARCSSVR